MPAGSNNPSVPKITDPMPSPTSRQIDEDHFQHLLTTIVSLRMEVANLRMTLEPFAGLSVYPGAPDDAIVIVANTAGGIIDTGMNRVTVGDLRRAAAALTRQQPSPVDNPSPSLQRQPLS